ncbi:uncharacterized protein A1O9_07280 [Exophiala aquamarina CBS 119918]|uniref:Uncharacterized protein n=1 Tax=Exophiala aquamarina CBS 119918 TaxID=1182545 RepID=A0A072PNH9_9EURO|nr:uncharacterized protein A1O9_07280 [Exophiala aquamarina CBS 119918]KEF57090.1 hypothetical protein A1O9_07280 [Exophiala aquamarina CBS 119918]
MDLAKDMALECPSPEPDDSTVCTGITPPETITDSFDAVGNAELRIPTAPAPGNTFFIRSVACGRFLKLFDGRLVLGHEDGCSSHWNCVEKDYWLGFKNMASGNYLGHSGGQKADLRCSVPHHRQHEYFTIRPVEGEDYIAYVLLTTFRERLSFVRMEVANEVESLVTSNNGSASDGIAWEFLKV